ncbi:chorismate lyase [Achromobacter sp. SD115]|uniref:chorismate--pyruvate lyase family protein n=1 Tax=Achromobacter sp. SD115 TaxID=2782011 RepID=UPI001A979065|nr:chorismate lyase [Achromobacter sp. SD115]MBO1013622.1 chorismate lyase [Achromobacter sp. SD115]
MSKPAAHHPPLASGWLASAPPILPPAPRHWLFRPGALTAGLRQVGQVRLRVLAEYADGAPPDEARAMGIAPGTPVWIREVLMSVNGVDSVPARSLTPLRASHGAWQGMRRLLTRPLADMLYHDSTVVRSPFACRRLAAPVPFHATALDVLPAAQRDPDAGRIWARRSVFWRQGQPLLVAECFLPAFWQLVADQPVPPLVPHQRTPR